VSEPVDLETTETTWTNAPTTPPCKGCGGDAFIRESDRLARCASCGLDVKGGK